MRDFKGNLEWDDEPITLTYERILLDGTIRPEKIILSPDRYKTDNFGITYQPSREGATLVFMPWARVRLIKQIRSSL